MLQRVTKQREALLNILKNTTSHPTAEWIWAEAKALIPDISFATVYRNLKVLKEIGRVKSVDVGDGKEHFDYDVSPHAHFKCTECGTVSDIFLSNSLLCDLHDVCKSPYQLVYIGLCDRCKI